MMRLSIIIIGRNEARYIDRCIRAALAAAGTVPESEILYVDSASTDDTVARASRYNIGIIQLRPSWRLTSAAGRYTGYCHARGEYVLFVDGDTLLYKSWPRKALDFLAEHPQAGGTAGMLHEIFIGDDGTASMKKNRYGQTRPLEKVKTFGGTAMYRRDALQRSGPFNPHIRATPELELSLRIRKEGFDLFRQKEQMAITYAPERETVREILRRSTSNMYSMGNTLRYCLRYGAGMQYIRERMGFILVYGAVLLAVFSAAAAAWIISEAWILYLLAMIVVSGLTVYAVLRKSIRQVLLSVIKRTVILYSTIYSFFALPVLDAEAYPRDVIIIKENREQ